MNYNLSVYKPMQTNKVKNFEKLVSNKQSGWKEKVDWRRENKEWLDVSFKIAVKILREIRRQKPMNGMSQKKLAEGMKVSPQYVNKMLKGKENLSLQTICKVEKVLGINLIDVVQESISQVIEQSTQERVDFKQYQKGETVNYDMYEDGFCIVDKPGNESLKLG